MAKDNYGKYTKPNIQINYISNKTMKYRITLIASEKQTR